MHPDSCLSFVTSRALSRSWNSFICNIFLVHAFCPLSHLIPTKAWFFPSLPLFSCLCFGSVLFCYSPGWCHLYSSLPSLWAAEITSHTCAWLEMGNIRETSSSVVVIQGSHLCLFCLRPFASPVLQLLSGDLSPSRLLL